MSRSEATDRGVPRSTSDVARPPTRGEKLFDRTFRRAAWSFATLVLVLLGAIVFEVGSVAAPAIEEHGARER